MSTVKKLVPVADGVSRLCLRHQWRNEEIELTHLAEGGVRLRCRRHPRYKGMRTPTAECDGCHEIHLFVRSWDRWGWT